MNTGGEVPTMDGIMNTNPMARRDYNYNTPIKTGIYIHSTGNNGNLGSYNSTGCLLILNTEWDSFNRSLSGVRSFKLVLNRTNN